MGDPGQRYTNREKNNQSQGRGGPGFTRDKQGILKSGMHGNPSKSGGINRPTKPGRMSK